MSHIFKQIFNRRMLLTLLMGFASGLPLLLVGSTLKAWMADLKMDLTTIGFFSVVGLPYTLKFLWSPFMDRYTIPKLGRRRGWALIAQIGLIASLATLAFFNPQDSTSTVAVLAFLVAFFSATQDIVLDAYRREILADEELGLGSSLFVNGYRIALLFAGGFALYLADHIPWKLVYLIMAASISVGVITILFAPEPKVDKPAPHSMRDAIVEPLVDFFKRPGAWLILAFILLYKIGDSMASEMTMPMYLFTGYTKTEVGLIVKGIGFWALIGGSLVGGVLILKLGIQRSLWIFGILQAVSTMGFAILANSGVNIPLLGLVIGFENLSGGMGTAAYVGYMASLTNKRFTATQYALLSSLMGVPRVFLGGPAGWMAKHMGWFGFFTTCTLIAIPGMLLLFKIAPWNASRLTDNGMGKTA